ncbi:MAG TPA: Maf family protein [Devosia sp.]|jgi:septum formation protein|uniref:Maf family protein n=1 Tax=Devosia sp. TaxID=1871048 RepID=UPI002DDD4E10|nr:Maf family protein [Devosia sp.]HEV2513914.1 Maf family protein [Devosia sp.]
MLILASQSATRKALLAGAGLRFETSPAQIDERRLEAEVLGKGGDARQVACRLAEAKALAVAASPTDIVIGADQVLACAGELLHKPENLAAAAAQLDRLAGRTHRLHAGLALAGHGRLLWSGTETAVLTMRRFDSEERDLILALEGGAVLGSVGAYRLEGPSIRLFEKIEGDYFTILGLPLLPLLQALRQHAPETLSQ